MVTPEARLHVEPLVDRLFGELDDLLDREGDLLRLRLGAEPGLCGEGGIDAVGQKDHPRADVAVGTVGPDAR